QTRRSSAKSSQAVFAETRKRAIQSPPLDWASTSPRIFCANIVSMRKKQRKWRSVHLAQRNKKKTWESTRPRGGLDDEFQNLIDLPLFAIGLRRPRGFRALRNGRAAGRMGRPCDRPSRHPALARAWQRESLLSSKRLFARRPEVGHHHVDRPLDHQPQD